VIIHSLPSRERENPATGTLTSGRSMPLERHVTGGRRPAARYMRAIQTRRQEASESTSHRPRHAMGCRPSDLIRIHIGVADVTKETTVGDGRVEDGVGSVVDMLTAFHDKPQQRQRDQEAVSPSEQKVSQASRIAWLAFRRLAAVMFHPRAAPRPPRPAIGGSHAPNSPTSSSGTSCQSGTRTVRRRTQSFRSWRTPSPCLATARCQSDTEVALDRLDRCGVVAEHRPRLKWQNGIHRLGV
jgi:hypothetical protein